MSENVSESAATPPMRVSFVKLGCRKMVVLGVTLALPGTCLEIHPDGSATFDVEFRPGDLPIWKKDAQGKDIPADEREALRKQLSRIRARPSFPGDVTPHVFYDLPDEPSETLTKVTFTPAGEVK